VVAAGPGLALAWTGNPSLDSPNDFGVLRTVTVDGSPIDTTHPLFFQPLGTNGRSCSSCHVASTGWTLNPSEVQARFAATAGLDPLFSAHDGANSPLADVSTVNARARAYSMLLSKGVIRMGLPIPAGAEFTLVAVDDPYGYASANELSLFRRPLPTTNLRFQTAVMWDGRDSSPQQGRLPILAPSRAYPIQPQLDLDAANLIADLQNQANDATLGHEQAMMPGLTAGERAEIANFEMNLATAQVSNRTGTLTAQGAQGGPDYLALQSFYVSINDSTGNDVHGNPFNPSAMTLFDAWRGSNDPNQAAIARGAAVFNARCTNCHDVPDVGNRSLDLKIKIGTSNASERYPGLPLYTLRNNATGQVTTTTDPGLALVTGKWADIGKFKVPSLRGLASRAPYFHNGLADTLDEVVSFYQSLFGFRLSDQARGDLIAFLTSL
jgi:cytochrome c peroxidase